MKASKVTSFLTLVLTTIGISTLYAGGVGTSGGLTLLEASGARASSLGEAFTGMNNDIAAFGYNPASLSTLSSGQASFLYEKGMAEDSYGQFMIGSPMKKSAMGLSVGYYNGGTIDLYDNGTSRSVTAQKDLSVALGYSRNFNGLSIGMTGKYLSSQLIDSYKASAYAADFGLSLGVGSRIRVGAAIQNLGSQLKFISEGDNLPRIARMGLSYNMIPGKWNTMLLLDAPYYLNEAEVRPAIGLETLVGPMAIRGGFKKTNGLNEFTVGAGFALGKSSIDYAFGLVKDLNAQHKVSLSMKFGGDTLGSNNVEFVKKREMAPSTMARKVEEKDESMSENKPEITFVQRKSLAGESKARRIYVVEAGDTLGKIARKVYGDSREWKKIYVANQHILTEGQGIEVGQKIVLP